MILAYPLMAMAVRYRPVEETSMNFKSFFAPKVGIRLTEDLNGFVCTVRRGVFRKESTAFSVNLNRNVPPEVLPRSVRRNPSYPVIMLRSQQRGPHL